MSEKTNREIMTEEQVRQIAKEEGMKVFSEQIRGIESKIDVVERLAKQNSETLARLERLLLGEIGTEKSDTLKARATFAYEFAKHNTDLRVIERTIPALVWFEDMSRKEPGCEESKLDTLGRMISAYTSLKWILRLVGFTSIVNLLLSIRPIIELIKNLLG